MERTLENTGCCSRGVSYSEIMVGREKAKVPRDTNRARQSKGRGRLKVRRLTLVGDKRQSEVVHKANKIWKCFISLHTCMHTQKRSWQH